MNKKQRNSIHQLLNILFVGAGLVVWYVYFSSSWLVLFSVLIGGVLLTQLTMIFIPYKKKRQQRSNSANKARKASTKSSGSKADDKYLLKADIQSLSGEEFEELCYMYFKDRGYKPKKTAKTGDHGVDLVLKDPSDGLEMAVQCKRYKQGRNIGNNVLRNLEGSKRYYKCTGTFFITTSNYTSKALEYAENVHMKVWNGLHVDQYIGQWKKEKLNKIS